MSDNPDTAAAGETPPGRALTPFTAPPADLPAPVAAPPSPNTPVPPSDDEWTIPVAVGVMQIAGLASIGAGAIHAAVVGSHAEFPTLARLFVVTAVAQLAVGLLALVKGGRIAALLAILVNGVAVGAWAVTRLWNVDWEGAGLTAREPAEFTDTTCAVLGAVAVLAATVAVVAGRTSVRKVRLGVPGLAVGAIVVVAMLVSTNHAHTHDAVASDGHSHDAEAATAEVSTGATDHTHTDDSATAEAVSVDPTAWPRAWDPADGVDLSGVPGVTRDQELRAAGLINRTLEELPSFADVATLPALGYKSIEDDSTGYEHFINYSYIGDDKFLDPTAPESLVFRVDGEERTLVSAMYIANDMPIDSPELVDYGGPLMQWHVHENLCWVSDSDGLRVVGVTDDAGNCPDGTFNTGGGNPMVHVWIAPHECGPFAALEGHGAGQVAEGSPDRVDQCAHDSGHDHGTASAAGGEPAGDAVSAEPAGDEPTGDVVSADAADVEAVAVPFDPTQPIDLSGTPGVTPEQQAFAENLIANTLTDLPQWADPEVAEAAGFRSIRDGATGHEHFINWDWINDDVFLDPDYPESLVYEPQPDGTRTLVSAMYMLPDSYTLADVPDWGGALMQWHIHDNLCFDTSGASPRVAGLTDAEGGCTAPLEKLAQSPMIHVWLTPTPCGPFAALEGVGAGQVAEGEEHLCDHAHGSG